ncbi:AMP-binding protein [Arthrobacter sp. NtRootA1]|uniref:class I adenylate-forming enzyme family protein n=1 Tax=Arthrobacter sp. NtRootA1 TaxID=2830983 RepID=UPI001CC50460|nr:AMP-binding protein [Arthrobacter sp. NtRootA1]BCW06013.1 long-chain-fatty-acid--CoA ligase [Arthrobacter sp. NtRootA1]
MTIEQAQNTDVSVLVSVPFARARQDPTGECIRDQNRSLDNLTFALDTAALAARLAASGVSRGDVVAILLPNCAEIVTTMFAAWSLGAALTPMNPALTDPEVIYQLQDSEAKVIIGDERAGHLAAGLKKTHIDAFTIHTGSPADPDNAPASVAVAEPEDFALIIYTSGTTGKPKGCVLDHSNITAMVTSISTHLEIDAQDTSLLVLPLFHSNGLLIGVLSVLGAGGTVVIAPRFDAKTFWNVVEAERPTFFSAVPTMYAMLEAQTTRAVDTSSLRFLVCGAAPMPTDLLERFQDRFGVPVVEGYGLSEGSVASTLNPLRGSRKAGTVGPVLPGQQVRIVTMDGAAAKQGEHGEILIKGANVMRGYLGRPGETAKVLHDGWLHTGDVGYLDEDGYLVLVDRIKDVIIRGGENIFPKEIEFVLYQHPDVLEAAVVGLPDPLFGEVPVAYVAPVPGRQLDVAELERHCLASLAKFKVPRQFVIIASLPKNSVGKIVKAGLTSC